jgi:ribosome-binding protein aMBF1 (putative translation factor)
MLNILEEINLPIPPVVWTGYQPNDTGYYKGDKVLAQQKRPEAFLISVGERLKLAREALGLTQTALAEKLGIKQNVLSQWESGKQLIDPLIAALLSSKLGITTDYIYVGNETGLPEEIRKKI